MKPFIISLFIPLLVIGFGYYTASTGIRLIEQHPLLTEQDPQTPPLYLPQPQHIRLVTLGYNNLASNLVWFYAQNYFGKHLATDRDYRWLGHMCEIATGLDPRATSAFEFCGTMLSWSARDPDKSNQILTYAIEAHPESWRFYYLRAFNYWYFLEQPVEAKRDLLNASRLPQAPSFLVSLASRLAATHDSPDTAIAFLTEMREHAESSSEKAVLEEKLKQAILTRDFLTIEKAIEVFEHHVGRKPEHIQELKEANIIEHLPPDPFGGSYYLEPGTGKVRTTSKVEPLVFRGKTARTGVARQEFSDFYE